MSRWHANVAKVLDGFVASFERQDDKSTRLFWDRVHANTRAGSGSDTYAGWAVVFSTFNKKGNWALQEERVGHGWSRVTSDGDPYNFGVLYGPTSSGITKAPLRITGATRFVGL